MGQNPTEDELQDFVDEIDVDGNGIIDFTEFTRMVSKLSGDVDDTMREAFKIFDTDDSGYVTIDEIRDVNLDQNPENQLAEDELEHIVRGADHDGNGHIDLEEFVKMLHDMECHEMEPEIIGIMK